MRRGKLRIKGYDGRLEQVLLGIPVEGTTTESHIKDKYAVTFAEIIGRCKLKAYCVI